MILSVSEQDTDWTSQYSNKLLSAKNFITAKNFIKHAKHLSPNF